jgi:acetylornithine deacetylase
MADDFPLEVKLSKKLVSIESVVSDKNKNVIPINQEIIDLTQGWLIDLGYKPVTIPDKERDRIGAIVAIGSDEELLFQGHLDTVQKGEWGIEKGKEHKYNWLGEISKDKTKLYGRGISDMKGQIGAFFAALHETKKRPHVILTTDEEIGHITGFEGARVGVKHLIDNGHTAKYAINMEPSAFKMVYARKGAIWGQLTVHGKSAHGSKPHEGINAIYHAASIIEAIKYHAEIIKQDEDEDLGYRTINVGMINGGSEPNTVAGSCTIDIESRLIPGETGEQARKKLVNSITAQTNLEHGKDFNFSELGMNRPGYKIKTEVAQKLLARIPKEHNITLGISKGLSENFMIGSFGIPTVTLGASSGSADHSSDEFIKLEDLTKIKNCYIALMENK